MLSVSEIRALVPHEDGIDTLNIDVYFEHRCRDVKIDSANRFRDRDRISGKENLT
jgi:adenylate cyclase class IV